MTESISFLFRVVTEAEFPYGLVCIRCDRLIKPGHPYSDALDSVLLDEQCTTISVLCCVYCIGEIDSDIFETNLKKDDLQR